MLTSRHLVASLIFIASLAAHAAPEGGMSGGGGNVIAEEPVSKAVPVELTAKIVRHAFSHVVPYLEYKAEKLQKGEAVPNEIRMLLTKSHVRTIAAQNPPQVLTQKPCLDGEQTEFDATNDISRPAVVCVSALRISKRLERDEIEAQSVALLIHEYSELVGFDDQDAIQIQRAVLSDFRESRHAMKSGD